MILPYRPPAQLIRAKYWLEFHTCYKFYHPIHVYNEKYQNYHFQKCLTEHSPKHIPPSIMQTSWPGLQFINNIRGILLGSICCGFIKDEELCNLLSLDLSTFKCLFPNVTLKLFQRSCFAIRAHLPDDIFNNSINDNVLAEIMSYLKS